MTIMTVPKAGAILIDTQVKAQYYPVTAQLILTLLLLDLTIVLNNLLFGLAVTDVQVFLCYGQFVKYIGS